MHIVFEVILRPQHKCFLNPNFYRHRGGHAFATVKGKPVLARALGNDWWSWLNAAT